MHDEMNLPALIERFGTDAKCRAYLEPLIAGEAYPPFEKGLPRYVRLKNVAVRKKTAGTFPS